MVEGNFRFFASSYLCFYRCFYATTCTLSPCYYKSLFPSRCILHSRALLIPGNYAGKWIVRWIPLIFSEGDQSTWRFYSWADSKLVNITWNSMHMHKVRAWKRRSSYTPPSSFLFSLPLSSPPFGSRAIHPACGFFVRSAAGTSRTLCLQITHWTDPLVCTRKFCIYGACPRPSLLLHHIIPMDMP